MASAVNGFSLLNLKPPTSLSKPRNLSLNFAKRAPSLQIRADSMATERLGIKVEKNPPESKLTELGVRQWPKYFDFYISFLDCFLLLIAAISLFRPPNVYWLLMLMARLAVLFMI